MPQAGVCAFSVLVAGDGSVLGRFSLYDVEDGTARLGYRVAERVAGRGVVTATVRAVPDGDSDADAARVEVRRQ